MQERSADRPEMTFVPRALRDLFLPRRIPREVRTAVEQWLESEPITRLLPAALELPLGLDLDLAKLMSEPHHIALIGPPASGRSLALAQIARRWLDQQPAMPLVRLLLGELDSPSLTPRAIVARALARRNLAPNPLEHNLPCLLLIDDWEELPLARRAIWQRFLTRLPERWSRACTVVALPTGELWPGFRHHAIAPLSAEHLAEWVQRLFTFTDRQEGLALFERDPLVLLRERPAEILMLALTQPLSGWPISRAALYERTAAFVAPIIVATDEQAGWRIGLTAYRLYRQAVELAAQATPHSALIRQATPHWRGLCIPLAFGAAPDPRPLIDALADAMLPSHERLSLLARSLRERPRLDPALSRPILDEICRSRGEALATLVPVLPVILTDIGRTQSGQINELLERITELLPPETSTTLLITILDTSDAPPVLRWQAIDLLCRQRILPPPLPTYADLISQAGRCLLAVAHPDTIHHLAEPALQLGLRLLLSGAAGTNRQYLIAHHLLAHTTLPASVRALAPAALPPAEVGQAIVDPMPEVRQAARKVWIRTGHIDQLARFVTQTDKPWSARDEALTDLATTADGQTFIAAFAISNRLPLDLRLRAIRLLNRLPNGTELLKRLLYAEHEPEIIRAAAIRSLCHNIHVITHLGPLLDRRHPPLIRRTTVHVLSAIARLHQSTALTARTSLLSVLNQPDLDAALTTTIIETLGKHGGKQALAALGHILAPTYGVTLLETWITSFPALIGPSEQWIDQADNPTVRALLADLMVAIANHPNLIGVALDRPSALIAGHVMILSSATACTLGTIGQHHPTLMPAVRALIGVALYDTSSLRPLSELLNADPTCDLAAIVRNTEHDPPLRYAALHALAQQPDGAEALLHLAKHADSSLACTALDQLQPPLPPTLTEQLLQWVHTATDEAVRLAGLRALGRNADPAAVPALLEIALNNEETPAIRAAALDAIVEAPVAPLTELITSQPEPIRSAALRALSRSPQPGSAPILHRLAFDPDRTCALAAVGALAAHPETHAPILGRLIRSHPDLAVRLAAAAAFDASAADETIPVFVEALLSPYPALQTQAFRLLAAIAPYHAALRQPLTDPQQTVVLRFQALHHLSTYKPNDPLIRHLANEPTAPEQLRCHAIAVLGRQADASVVDVLLRLAGDATQPLAVKHAAIAALDRQWTEVRHEAALTALITLVTSSIPEVALWAGTVLLDRLVPIEIGEP